MTDDQAVCLLRAIREHSSLELSSIRDAGTYGADAGFAGFTYTRDGADFTDANGALLDELLQLDSDDFGHDNVAQFIATFGRADMTDTLDGYKCLIAWYALETAGRWLNDRREARGL
jgi:hypothetical protein